MLQPRKTLLVIIIACCCLCVFSCKNGNSPTTKTDTTALKDTTGFDHAVTRDLSKRRRALIKPINPNASSTTNAAYDYPNKMEKGTRYVIKVVAQLDKPVSDLKPILQEIDGNPNETHPSDSITSGSISLEGSKFLEIKLRYDAAFFAVDAPPARQELFADRHTEWLFNVTAGKVLSGSSMIMDFTPIDADGKVFPSRNRILKIEVIDLSADRGHKKRSRLLPWYAWISIATAVILLGLLLFRLRKKKAAARKMKNAIFFSYAWGEQSEGIVDKLYTSLKNDGFNVVRDKVDLQYREIISDYMKEIGKANFIVVALSDKYFKSKFCMYELFHIWINSEMDKEKFTKRLFPLRVENINLGAHEVVDMYIDHWRKEQKELEDRPNRTIEEAKQLDAIRRMSIDIGNILDALSDINALDIAMLSDDNFARIKTALREATLNI